MKSPRDILLEQHQDQSRALDEIRRQVIAEHVTVAGPSLLAIICGWLNLNRATWGAFATSWVAIIALNLAAGMDSIDEPRGSGRADVGDVFEGLKEYQAQLARLLDEPRLDPEELDDPDSTPRGPRGDVDRPRRDARLRSIACA